MNFSARQIADLLGGVVDGDGDVSISNVSKIEEGTPGTLAFLANPKYEHYLYSTQASVVLVNRDFVPKETYSATLIRVDSAYEAIATLLEAYNAMTQLPSGIEQPSFIDSTAHIGEEPYIGAFAYVGKNCRIGHRVKIYPQVFVGNNVKIGDDTILYPGVKLYHDCVVGNRCILHAGSVIGADGFGFAPEGDDYKKIPQIGNVVIDDEVEIGANTCIDRSTMGSTRISRGVKLDNLIQIAHNVTVGEHTVIAAQTGIAGSAHIGTHCTFGGQTGIAGHLTVGDRVSAAGASGIVSNIAANSVVRGNPCFDISRYNRCYVLFRKLPDLFDTLCALQKKVALLESTPL